jgi:amino acid transporter
MQKRSLKHVIFGKPIHERLAHHERLNVPFGLAVFASDALSSVAYATEEVLLVLILAGSLVAYNQLPPIAIALAVLLAIVAFSYYQTVHAYPDNGGTYVVSTDNLGSGAGQFAGAALLIDYVLTVAVSISSGVQAVISLAPQAQPYAIHIACAAVGILCFMNLRGAKESGIVFAIPTYGFIILILILIGNAIVTGVNSPQITPNLPPHDGDPLHQMGLFLVLRAFAASCTALTGTEAIANGVKAFKPPEARHASQALVAMVVLLGVMFIGISWVAHHSGIVPMHSGTEGYKTVLAQISINQFGNGPMTWAIMIMTAGILFLAANTAYADFPRLASFIARDGFLPRQLASIGDRLVFQNGIILLSIVSIALIIKFNADTHSLIPLYALGVFIAFTLSQAGMFVYFRKRRWMVLKRKDLEANEENPVHTPQERIVAARKLAYKSYISAFGCLVTFIVSGILVVTKWEEKIWIVVIAMGVIMAIFTLISRYYKKLATKLSVTNEDTLPELTATTLLLVPRLHKGILQAIKYAQASSPDVRALHVSLNQKSAEKLKEEWIKFGVEMPLIILDSPYRSIVQPTTEYIDELLEKNKKRIVNVIVPEAVPNHWYQALLHNNAAIQLKLALAKRKNVVITNVRYFIEEPK